MVNLFSDVYVDRNQTKEQTLNSKGRCLMRRLGACVAVITLVLMASISIAEEVSIPDPNLETAIREAIGKPTGPITEEDLQGITSLDEARAQGIEDLTGLEHCTNLQTLWLGFNQIADISPLSGLSNLQLLSLACNQIADISPLSGLTNLQILHLGWNQAADISPLSGLSNLQSLNLGGGNQITDISPLSGLSNLQRLDIAVNQISDISPLSGLYSLRYIDLQNNQIVDLSSLSGLIDLQTLNLSCNNISDVTPLAGLTNLYNLHFQSNHITDISPLSGLTNLQHLNAHSNPISEAPLFFSELNGLTWLSFGNNNVADISPLSGLTSIGDEGETWSWWGINLWLDRCNITDLQSLVDNPGINSGDVIALWENPLSDESVNTLIPLLEERGVTVLKVWGTTLMKIPNVSASPNSSTTVLVSVGYPGDGPKIAGANMDIEYDAEMLTIGEITTTDLSAGMVLTVNTTEPGIARIALAGTAGIQKSGDLVNIGFGIAEGAPFGATSPLHFSKLELKDEMGQKIVSQSIDGSLTITGLLGDVNGDGRVDSGDAILVLRISVGLLTPTPYQQWAGDVNEDGWIDAGDAILILRKSVGLPSFKRIPLAKVLAGVDVSVSDTTAYPGEQTFVSISVSDATGIAGGDLTLTYNPDILTAQEVKGTVLATGLLVVSNTSTPGEVRISLAGAAGLSGGSGSLIEVIFEVREDAVAGRTSLLSLTEVTLRDETGNPQSLGTISEGTFTVGGVSVEERETMGQPDAFALSQNYPNPFNAQTVIAYVLPEEVYVKLSIYNTAGQLIRELIDTSVRAGHHKVVWDGRDSQGKALATGIYLIRLEAGAFTEIQKMALLR